MANSNVNFANCIIIHGCPPNAQSVMPQNKRWMNWLAVQLNRKGWNTVAPEMPIPWKPVYADWKKVFEHYPVTEKSLLVGHSCGAAFLVRWLLEKQISVKKLILVAPAKIPETPDDQRQALYDFIIPAGSGKIAKEIVIFTSNDFPHHKKALALYINALKPAKVVELKNKVHFLFFSMGTNEFPELLAEILRTKNHVH